LIDLVFHRFGIPVVAGVPAATSTLVPDNVIPALVAENKSGIDSDQPLQEHYSKYR
jgi:hypothetical protein